MLGRGKGLVLVHFRAAEQPPRPEVDTEIVLVETARIDASGRAPARILGLDTRAVGWTPTALLLALIIASPVSWSRRWRALGWGAVLARIFHSFCHRNSHLPAGDFIDGDGNWICGLKQNRPSEEGLCDRADREKTAGSGNPHDLAGLPAEHSGGGFASSPDVPARRFGPRVVNSLHAGCRVERETSGLGHVYLQTVVAVYLWNQSSGAVPVSFLHFWPDLAGGLEESLVNQMGASLAIPVLIWLAVTFRADDAALLPGPVIGKRAVDPHGRGEEGESRVTGARRRRR